MRDSEAIKNKTSHVSAIVSKFPSRKKQKAAAAKKAEKYDDSFSKNEEHLQRIAMLKLQSEAQVSISQSQKLRANMDFLKMAMEAKLPHLDKIKNVAVKSFFDQNDESVPGSKEDNEEVVVVATLSPTNNRAASITNTQGIVPLNQSELVLSSDSDEDQDDHFGTRSRSSLDTSDQTQDQTQK